MPTIDGPFVVEAMPSKDATENIFIKTVTGVIIEPIYSASGVTSLIVSGVPQIPYLPQAQYNLGVIENITRLDMDVGVFLVPLKQINELDQISSEKQIRPFGSQVREYWF